MFADAEDTLTLEGIYEAVKEGYPLTGFQKESDGWGGPRFHHEIRAVINQFLDDGEIFRVSRGLYKKMRN